MCAYTYANEYWFENRVLSFYLSLFLPICLKCVTPLVKLDRQAEMNAHVGARVISDA